MYLFPSSLLFPFPKNTQISCYRLLSVRSIPSVPVRFVFFPYTTSLQSIERIREDVRPTLWEFFNRARETRLKSEWIVGRLIINLTIIPKLYLENTKRMVISLGAPNKWSSPRLFQLNKLDVSRSRGFMTVKVRGDWGWYSGSESWAGRIRVEPH